MREPKGTSAFPNPATTANSLQVSRSRPLYRRLPANHSRDATSLVENRPASLSHASPWQRRRDSGRLDSTSTPSLETPWEPSGPVLPRSRSQRSLRQIFPGPSGNSNNSHVRRRSLGLARASVLADSRHPASSSYAGTLQKPLPH